MAVEEYPIVVGRGDDNQLIAIYRETLPDGSPGDPIDLTGMTADLVVSGTLEALPSTVTPDPDQVVNTGVVLAEISAADSVLWPEAIRYRLRVIDGLEPTTILTGSVTYG